jgi:phosphonate transport system substrate-binding protein
MKRPILMGLIFSLGLIVSIASYGQESPKKGVLTMGRVATKTLTGQRHIEPIVTYLASRLRDVGVERGEVVIPSDNKVTIEYLKEGKLDVVLETPFSAYQYKIGANATPVFLALRKGVGMYNSLVFVRKDSGIRKVEDLKGKVIAFEDPGSTSSYFLPKFSIQAEGLELVEVSSPDSPVPGDKIGYIFAGSEVNISTWVYFKKVAGGAFSNMDWADQGENPAAYRKEFEVIYETQKVPRMLVMVREGLDARLVTRIKEELLNMHKTRGGREALKEFKLEGFAELPVGQEEVFRPIENLSIKDMPEGFY